MRASPLLLCLTILLLAGCADEAPTDDAVVAPTPVPAAPAPEPVEVQERADLREGHPPAAWNFEVAPNATGRIAFRLETPATGAFVSNGYCFTHEFTGAGEEEASSSCSDGLSVGLGTQESLVLFDEAPRPGTYAFTFSAEPTLGALVVDVLVEYPA